jgi:hypothetical protein
MVGQNSIEYGKLPMVPRNLPSPASTLASRVGDQSSDPKSPTVVDIPSQEPGKTTQAGSTKAGAQTAAVPSLPATFILSNGDQLESSNYMLTSDSLQVVQNGVRRTIPMSAVNIEATVAANNKRGIKLNIPQDKSQVMLSF